MKIEKKAMQLYAITDRSWLNGSSLYDVTESILKAGVTFLQLREKELSHDEIVKEAVILKKLAHKYNVPFVINDDIYAAKEADADGVHIGQSDMAYEEARKILGPDKIIGVTAKTVEQAVMAEKVGADYIGTGAVYHTSTKKDAKDMSRETLLDITSHVSIPIVAIGGITYDNCPGLKGTGVDGIAVISAIYADKDPSEAAGRLYERTRSIFGY